MKIFPRSTKNVPAMEFISVDLPAPLPPMTVTNSPGARCSESPVSATFSVIVPGLKVFAMFSMRSNQSTALLRRSLTLP